ncbi:ATP-dependent DNA helicase RecQ-like [Haliotis rubra]|uniref:ATP-dependent DNA helicase RecQ-like n=1 Tax=Haliotis rubra TaxID=36100 RepID=UPI001EE51DAF|nr:ATP-dependent DNA helicase RecQ-like [Haliotis rubra]
MSYLKGNDVLFCSPTGSGKSLTFEIAPFVYKQLHNTNKATVIVVSPLVALVKNQNKKAQSLGMKSVYLRDVMEACKVKPSEDNLVSSVEPMNIQELQDGEANLIFTSPESVLGKYRDLVTELDRMELPLRERMHLDHLRDVLGLCMANGTDTPRMIIFFRQTSQISRLYAHLAYNLKDKAYVDFNPNGRNDDRNRMFDMFHKSTDDSVKESICEAYIDPHSFKRVLVVSTSFSMGLDVQGVRHIIHYGPANNVEEYMQETGRAG